jgi:putative membrane protein insertion efficiency factor
MKQVYIYFLVIFPLLIYSKIGSAQLSKYIQGVDSLFEPAPKIDYKIFSKGSKNEVEATFSTMFIFYKNFISSQDIDACVFQPSCSVFAIECIHHEKSKLTAFVKISDRLMRCHPLISPGTYKTDEKSNKFYDPVEN